MTYKEKPFFPFLWVLLSQLMFGAASPRVLLDPSPSSSVRGFLVAPALCAELIYGPGSGGSEGKSVWEWAGGWGRGSCGQGWEGISCCFQPDAPLLGLAHCLGVISTLLFQGMLVYPRVDDLCKNWEICLLSVTSQPNTDCRSDQKIIILQVIPVLKSIMCWVRCLFSCKMIIYNI